MELIFEEVWKWNRNPSKEVLFLYIEGECQRWSIYTELDAASERVDLTIGRVSYLWWLIEAMESILLCLGVVVVAWGLMNTREIINWRGEAKSQGTGKIILQFSVSLNISLTSCKAQTANTVYHPIQVTLSLASLSFILRLELSI